MNTPQEKTDDAFEEARESGLSEDEAFEKAASDECKRNGHRDTGRGVCAECGKFL